MQTNLNTKQIGFGMAHIQRGSIQNFDSETRKILDHFISADSKSIRSVAKDIDVEYSKSLFADSLILTLFPVGQNKVTRFFSRIAKHFTNKDKAILSKKSIKPHNIEIQISGLKK